MAKGDFFFPFMYQRFYTSTRGWTEEQEGAYLRLLTYQFDQGSIPNDMKLIKKISPKAVKYWSFFSSKFIQNSEGNFINPVMAELREKANSAHEIRSLNGKKGAQKKWQGHQLANGIPVTNNHNQKERTLQQEGEDRAPGLQNSNLYRKPVIPTKQQVWEVFTGCVSDRSKARKMAKAFWEKYEGTGWFINGSPVVSFSALAQKFITTWNDKEKSQEAPTTHLKPI